MGLLLYNEKSIFVMVVGVQRPNIYSVSKDKMRDIEELFHQNRQDEMEYANNNIIFITCLGILTYIFNDTTFVNVNLIFCMLA